MNARTSICRWSAAALSIVCIACPGVAGDSVTKLRSGNTTSDAERTFFENRIRPILVNHCYECHGSDSDQLGGNLRLDDRDALRHGGESGSPIAVGKPDKSLIIQALKYDGVEMPPSDPLSPQVIMDFETWVSRGAFDPRIPRDVAQEVVDNEKQKSDLWSFQDIERPLVPDVKDRRWASNPIDRFVQAKRELAGIAATNFAGAETLVRRLYVDLNGMPPTFEQTQSFVESFARDRDRAIGHLVDDLLSRPAFGERWGRHWLDVARYGESNGNDGLSRNPTFPHAWRYRDYVIDSLNADVPYDQFLIQQIAGDLLPVKSPEESDRNKVATGFLAMAAKPAKAMNNDFDMDVVADQVDMIGRGVMGLSVGCARCHDHKFDPVPTRDYYALAGIFTSTETMWGLAGNEKLTAPATDLHVLETAPRRQPPDDFVETVILLESATGLPKVIPKPKWPQGTPLAMGVRDGAKIKDCKVNINGDSKKLGKLVPRGFLSAIQLDDSQRPESKQTETTRFRLGDDQSGRLQLARWLTDPNHPLTARVIVNRIWLHLFGEGIVGTPDDFGQYGQRPTHPKMLDYLARRFVDRGWSIKQLIREIVRSRTYQLSADVDPSLLEHDNENRLLTRHLRRRMDAETIRDSMLLASGELNLTPGDGSIVQHRDILVNLAGSLHQPSQHRSIYLCYLRSSPPPELAPFNLPEFDQVVGKRETTVVSSQSLHLLNSPFVFDQSEQLARFALANSIENDDRIRIVYRRVFGRDPSLEEIADVSDFIGAVKEDDQLHVWATLCQALFMTNEFRYVD